MEPYSEMELTYHVSSDLNQDLGITTLIKTEPLVDCTRECTHVQQEGCAMNNDTDVGWFVNVKEELVDTQDLAQTESAVERVFIDTGATAGIVGSGIERGDGPDLTIELRDPDGKDPLCCDGDVLETEVQDTTESYSQRLPAAVLSCPTSEVGSSSTAFLQRHDDQCSTVKVETAVGQDLSPGDNCVLGDTNVEMTEIWVKEERLSELSCEETNESVESTSSSQEQSSSRKQNRTQQNIVLHVKTRKRKYPCNLCPYSSHTASNIANHMRTHTGENLYGCPKCTAKFAHRPTLSRHLKTHFEKLFSCNLCRREFHQEYQLSHHMLLPCNPNSFTCNVCQRKFEGQKSLEVHLQLHTGVKPFSCDVCSESFSHKACLIEHKTNHNREKVKQYYHCDQCPKRFTSKYYLLAHKLLHNKDNPFACDKCEKQFTHLLHLTEHKRVHTGEKPYKCKVCKKKFHRKQCYYSHMKLHKKDKWIICDVC